MNVTNDHKSVMKRRTLKPPADSMAGKDMEWRRAYLFSCSAEMMTNVQNVLTNGYIVRMNGNIDLSSRTPAIGA
jgi:hypothetical protein